jgi:hypothetical protein
MDDAGSFAAVLCRYRREAGLAQKQLQGKRCEGQWRSDG